MFVNVDQHMVISIRKRDYLSAFDFLDCIGNGEDGGSPEFA